MIDFVSHHAGLIGLILFFTFFMAVGLLTFRPTKKGELQAFAQIPLQEKQND